MIKKFVRINTQYNISAGEYISHTDFDHTSLTRWLMSNKVSTDRKIQNEYIRQFKSEDFASELLAGNTMYDSRGFKYIIVNA